VKWSERAANRMLSAGTKIRANTSSVIVRRKAPQGRRNLCYNREGQKKREKEGLPVAGNVLDIAAAMGIEPLTEEQYRQLQKLGSFDTKSQSWLKTPSEITKLGGAIFGDRRFGRVFVYHNTAPCFYRGRGFRGSLKT
jgi:hypothetical protein